MSYLTDAEIDRRLNLHSPVDPEINATLDALRASYKRLLKQVADSVDPNREAALAVTHLEQSLQWAIASIVRPDLPRPVYPPDTASKAGGL